MNLQAEPYRLFFPLAIVLALAGIAPWVLHALGALPAYPAMIHVGLLTHGFALAIITGFLGTMIPRRSQTPPLSRAALGALGLALAVVAVGAIAQSVAWVAGAGLAVLGMLLAFVVDRGRRSRATTPPPPSFLFLPVALATGVAGELLTLGLLAVDRVAEALAARVVLVDGMLAGLVLALAPMLSPMVCDDDAAAPVPPWRRGILRVAAPLFGLLSLAPIAAPWLASGTGRGLQLLRAAIVLWVVVVECRAWRRPRAPGFHRWLVRLALFAFALAPAAAALTSTTGARIALQHLGWIGGLLLLSFAISVHVALHHGARRDEARQSPLLVVATGLLFCAAALVRAAAPLARGPALSEATLYALAAAIAIAAGSGWLLHLVVRLRPPLTHTAS